MSTCCSGACNFTPFKPAYHYTPGLQASAKNPPTSDGNTVHFTWSFYHEILTITKVEFPRSYIYMLAIGQTSENYKFVLIQFHNRHHNSKINNNKKTYFSILSIALSSHYFDHVHFIIISVARLNLSTTPKLFWAHCSVYDSTTGC